MASTVPPTPDMGATTSDETGIASLGKPLPVLNCEVTGQVANGNTPDVNTNGVLIVGISIFRNQDGFHELVRAVFCAPTTDPHSVATRQSRPKW